jgi:sugar lactone lactonase YvrE
MKKIYLILVLMAAVLLWQGVAKAQFVNGANADGVLGQLNFGSSGNVTSQNGMYYPYGIAVDAAGNLYVADCNNHRVLRFNSAASKANGANADGVLGQPNFSSNSGVIGTQNGMYWPYGVAVDASGNLYVADAGNHRVLKFSHAASKANGANADTVLGQPNFTSSGGSLSQSRMNFPIGVAVDAAGNLYVADANNNRVLKFSRVASKANGANADTVLGQPNFTSNTTATSQNGMNYPQAVVVDASGNLYVADDVNNRVLRFNNAASKAIGANADGVLGQPNFSSKSVGMATANGMNTPSGVATDATGNLYVADDNNKRVLRFNSAASKGNGANADGVLGQANLTSLYQTVSQNGMDAPFGVAIDAAGNLYSSDWIANRVLRFNAGTLLPVELSSFSALASTNGVLLTWTTASEKNNVGFDVERSADNNAFTKIAFVKGYGTTTQSHTYSFSDQNASGKVFYRLKQTDYDGKFEYSKTVEVKAGTPTVFTLSQNYPNPFNPSTTITYSLPQAGQVTLKVYDMLGREVLMLVNEIKAVGNYAATFQADKFSSGMYFYRLQAGNFVQTKKMLLVK